MLLDSVSVSIGLQKNTIHTPHHRHESCRKAATLIPSYGMMGTAIATLVSFAIVPIISYWISRRYYRIEYEWVRLAKIAIAAALIHVASILVGQSYSLVQFQRSGRRLPPDHIVNISRASVRAALLLP